MLREVSFWGQHGSRGSFSQMKKQRLLGTCGKSYSPPQWRGRGQAYRPHTVPGPQRRQPMMSPGRGSQPGPSTAPELVRGRQASSRLGGSVGAGTGCLFSLVSDPCSPQLSAPPGTPNPRIDLQKQPGWEPVMKTPSCSHQPSRTGTQRHT